MAEQSTIERQRADLENSLRDFLQRTVEAPGPARDRDTVKRRKAQRAGA